MKIFSPLSAQNLCLPHGYPSTPASTKTDHPVLSRGIIDKRSFLTCWVQEKLHHLLHLPHYQYKAIPSLSIVIMQPQLAVLVQLLTRIILNHLSKCDGGLFAHGLLGHYYLLLQPWLTFHLPCAPSGIFLTSPDSLGMLFSFGSIEPYLIGKKKSCKVFSLESDPFCPTSERIKTENCSQNPNQFIFFNNYVIQISKSQKK